MREESQTVNVPKALHRAIKTFASRKGLKLRDAVVDALREWLKSKKGGKL